MVCLDLFLSHWFKKIISLTVLSVIFKDLITRNKFIHFLVEQMFGHLLLQWQALMNEFLSIQRFVTQVSSEKIKQKSFWNQAPNIIKNV